MNFSRQTLLGAAMMIGGSVVLFALAQQVSSPDQPQPDLKVIEKNDVAETKTKTSEPLTIDVETEQRILAQKQKEREARVAKQELRAKEFLAEQEKAEAAALAKARAENQQYLNAVEPISDDASPEIAAASAITKPTVKPRVDPNAVTPPSRDNDDSTNQSLSDRDSSSVAASSANASDQAKRDNKPAQSDEASQKPTPKKKAQEDKSESKKNKDANTEQAQAKTAPASPQEYEVKRGDALIRLARQYGVPVGALAQANDLSINSSLQVGQELTIPSRRQIARLEREAEEARRRQEAAKTAQQRLEKARREAARGEAKGQFGVQVALADNQEKADEVAKKMRKAGYKVSTSATSRGVRVIVGPEKGKPAALALKDKINADPRTGVNKAWVLYWR